MLAAMTFNSIERIGAPFHSVAETGFVIPRHGQVEVNNSEFKLLCFLAADCVLTVPEAGEWRLRNGDVLVVPRACRQVYRCGGRASDGQVHALKITFSLAAGTGGAERAGVRSGSADPERELAGFALHHFRDIRHVAAPRGGDFESMLRAIRREAEQHQAGLRHRIHALCADLTVQVARLLHVVPRQIQEARPGPVLIVNQAKEFLMREMGRDLTLAEVAWQVKKSEEHLARVFRKVTGQTIFDYLRIIRLESAKTRLINSDKTLTEIATLCGFSSLALFSRNFSQHVGQSPSAYRQASAAEAVMTRTPARRG